MKNNLINTFLELAPLVSNFIHSPLTDTLLGPTASAHYTERYVTATGTSKDDCRYRDLGGKWPVCPIFGACKMSAE